MGNNNGYQRSGDSNAPAWTSYGILILLGVAAFIMVLIVGPQWWGYHSPTGYASVAFYYGLTGGTGNNVTNSTAAGPSDYLVPILPCSPVPFPRGKTYFGPIAYNTTSVNRTSFLLPDVGLYEIDWSVQVSGPGQLQLIWNGVAIDKSTASNQNLITGNNISTVGGDNIIGHVIFYSDVPNSVILIYNPCGNLNPLYIASPAANTTFANVASLSIKQFTHIGYTTSS